MDWQPIETAPTDGRSFLACVAGCEEPVIARYVDILGRKKLVTAAPDEFDTMEEWAEFVAWNEFPATHWKPLPVPPAKEES